MSTMVLFLLILALLLSPILLLNSKVFDKKSFTIALVSGTVVVLLPMLGFGNKTVLLEVMLVQLVYFVSLVWISRLRQRKSTFLLAIVSVFSNGGWFLMMYTLSGAYLYTKEMLHGAELSKEFMLFMLIIIAGTLCGRLVGVQWMQSIERTFDVTTERVGSAKLKKLDEKTNPVLLVIWVMTIIISWIIDTNLVVDVLIIMALGFLQNSAYSMSSRFSNQNHPGWAILPSIVATVMFITQAVFLLRYTSSGSSMPLSLLLPYIIGTLVGTNYGVVVSEWFEKKLKLSHPDKDVKEKKSYAHIQWDKMVLGGLACVAGIYLLFNTPILYLFGVVPQKIELPFMPFENSTFHREVAYLIVGAFYFANEAMFTLLKRAGNRNSPAYHALLCGLLGFIVFWTNSFLILNARVVDIIPVAIFANATGVVFGQRFSYWVEKKITSLMDVPPEPEKKKA